MEKDSRFSGSGEPVSGVVMIETNIRQPAGLFTTLPLRQSPTPRRQRLGRPYLKGTSAMERRSFLVRSFSGSSASRSMALTAHIIWASFELL